MTAILMTAPMLSECFICGELVEIGDAIVWDKDLPKHRRTRHAGCTEAVAILDAARVNGAEARK